MIKVWTDDAWDDVEYWMKQDKKTLRRILILLKDIERNHCQGIGKSERLSGDLSAYWSMRIDEVNRIVYRIDGETMKIVQALTTGIIRLVLNQPRHVRIPLPGCPLYVQRETMCAQVI